MPQVGIVALAVAASAVVAVGRLRYALATLMGVSLLVPATLVVPNGFTPALTMGRVVLVVFVVSLVVRRRRGELPRDAFAVTPVHVAFGVFLLVALVNGILVPLPTLGVGSATLEWLRFVDQLLLFFAVVAAIRVIDDDWWVAGMIAVLFLATVGIALGEHFTEWSWGRFVFQGNPVQEDALAAAPLGTREGQVRVRAAAAFPLEYAWIGVTLLPVLTIRALHTARPWLAAAAPVAALLAIYWTITRTGLIGAAVAVLLLYVTTRFDRHVAGFLLAAAVVAAVAFVVAPSVLDPFFGEQAEGSLDVRAQRPPVVTELVADDPYLGLGFGGLRDVGVPTTDLSYLLIYASLGVVGLVAHLVLLGTAGICSARALRGPPGRGRLVGAAAFSGVVAAILGGGAFDFFSLQGSTRSFWFLVALAVAISEREMGRRPPVPASVTPVRVGAVALAVLFGFGLRASAPEHAAGSFRLATVPVEKEAESTGNLVYLGQVFSTTACGIAQGVEDAREGVAIRCRELRAGPGLAILRVQAGDPSGVAAGVEEVADRLDPHFSGFALAETEPITRGVPTWARTAPVWASEIALALALLFPRRRTRRRRTRRPRVPPDEPTWEGGPRVSAATRGRARPSRRGRPSGGEASLPDRAEDAPDGAGHRPGPAQQGARRAHLVPRPQVSPRLADAVLPGPGDEHPSAEGVTFPERLDGEGPGADPVVELQAEDRPSSAPLPVDEGRRGLVPAGPPGPQDPPEGVLVLARVEGGAGPQGLVEPADLLEGGATERHVGTVAHPPRVLTGEVRPRLFGGEQRHPLP